MRAIDRVIRAGNARNILAEERGAKIRDRVDGAAADTARSFGDPFRRRTQRPGLSARNAEMRSSGFVLDRQSELAGAELHFRQDLISGAHDDTGNDDDVLLRIEFVPGLV